MRISKLHLQNIGVFENETIEFKEKVDPKKAEIHILTGKNGTGKSTILYALASFYLWSYTRNNKFKTTEHHFNSLFGPFFQRLRDKKNVEWDVFFEHAGQQIQMLQNFDKGLLSSDNLKIITDFLEKTDFPTDYKFNFLFAAYSGNRSMQHVELEGVKEISENPFDKILDFHNSIQPHRFMQWVANLKTKIAFAQSENNQQKTAVYKETLSLVENAVTEITGKEVKFHLEYEPFNLYLKTDGYKLNFDALADGFKSVISWMGDLLMRLDRIPWENNTPILERNFVLFLDEIEVHLHPAWQRKILPVVQELFPNAQIFISTHSPFVVGSVDDAWVYHLEGENGDAKVKKVSLSDSGKSYETILEDVFSVKEDFGVEVEQEFTIFYRLKAQLLKKEAGASKEKFTEVTRKLLDRGSLEIEDIISLELRQFERQTGEKVAL